MSIRKVFGANPRDAMRRVREQIGSDAVILQNRPAKGGVELYVMPANEMDALLGVPDAFAAATRGSEVEDGEGWDSAPKTAQAISQMQNQLLDMRTSLEEKLSGIAWEASVSRDPTKAKIMKEMLAAGFSAALARYLTDKQPTTSAGDDPLSWVKKALERNIVSLSDSSEMIGRGGIFALVGPTGVGKTTTTAKLAAKFVMEHGPTKLGLITTDNFRLGAYQHLKEFGRILNVMVVSVKDEIDLRIALQDLSGKHTILIDTVGMSQRDNMVANQIALLSSSPQEVKRLLCMSATATGETLGEIVRSYKGNGLAGCIMTKMDEAATIGGVLDVIVKHKLPLVSVANGQRVPEDLCSFNSSELIEEAFRLKRDTGSYHLKDSEIGLIAGAMQNSAEKSLREVIDLG